MPIALPAWLALPPAHRVKLQFGWQRGQRPQPGGLGHDETSPDQRGNAPGNEASGTWVRVAGPAAGANWGAVYTPRIGFEVSVGFIEGDIDRPVVTGGLCACRHWLTAPGRPKT